MNVKLKINVNHLFAILNHVVWSIQFRIIGRLMKWFFLSFSCGYFTFFWFKTMQNGRTSEMHNLNVSNIQINQQFLLLHRYVEQKRVTNSKKYKSQHYNLSLWTISTPNFVTSVKLYVRKPT